MKKLYGFNLNPADNFVDVGGGDGQLSLELISSGFKVRAFIEPNHQEYFVAK